VVESSLDDGGEDNHRPARFGIARGAAAPGVSRMPMVRVFSLETKAYVFADVDDLADYEYDAAALDRLYLPGDMKSVLRQVFQTPTADLFGDIIRGKHGGTVILASGSPGVGKTLTAEVYAEMTGRPLYVLEFGELGTTVREIEESLERVFARVVRWGAVLQFDECEVFLSHRGGDLERSAIVGIFLRMLDYYQGLLFLTSNRPEALDVAIRSRVMLWLEYPDLDRAGRAQVWRTMFEAAGLRLTDGTFDDLAGADMNGRQIRNLVRLGRILHPGRQLAAADVRGLLRFGCR
jgi:SpoVK/Ycf46/Vps4 family AAA+-type ATPase